jgi:hypothetical protein
VLIKASLLNPIVRHAHAAAAVVLLSTTAASAQVTPPLVMPPGPDATVIAGTCVNGATIHTTIAFAGLTVVLPDRACDRGTFAIDMGALPVSGIVDVALDQVVNGATSAQTKVRVTRPGSKPSPPLASPLVAGDLRLTGTCSKDAVLKTHVIATTKTGDGREQKTTIALEDGACASGTFAIDLRAIPLGDTFVARMTQTVAGVESDAVEIPVAPRPAYDGRPDFLADAYLGVGIDNFAAQEIQRYINPEANGTSPARRAASPRRSWHGARPCRSTGRSTSDGGDRPNAPAAR